MSVCLCRQPWARNKQGALPPAALGRARIAQPGPATTVPRLRLKYALQARRASLSLQSLALPRLAAPGGCASVAIWLLYPALFTALSPPSPKLHCVVASFASGTPISSHAYMHVCLPSTFLTSSGIPSRPCRCISPYNSLACPPDKYPRIASTAFYRSSLRHEPAAHGSRAPSPPGAL